MLKAVLFDLDNTLIDRNEAFDRCLQDEFCDPATRTVLRALDAGGHGERLPLLEAWRQGGGRDLNVAQLGLQIASRIQPVPGLAATLHSVAQRLAIGLVSNGGSRTQRAKLQRAGLDSVFSPDRIWISEEVGLSKPDARLYALICHRLGTFAADCLFVGDHELHDVAGPRLAGMRARRVESVLDSESVMQILREEGFG